MRSHEDKSLGERTAKAERKRQSSRRTRDGDEAAANVIESAAAPMKTGSKAPKPKTPATAPDRSESAGAGTRLERDIHSRALPDEIRERFIGIGRNYYFPDGAAAFRDHGKKLTTQSENTEVIRGLIVIAGARGWSQIAVSGSERFRKEAWFAGLLAGLEVRGYRPTEFEEERIARAIARREAGAAGNHAEVPQAAPATGRKSNLDRPAQSRRHSLPAWSNVSLITGRLVDHGRANYRHDPKEPMSYYIRLETERGDREIWGVDLERAFRESVSRPTIGDEVTARGEGRIPVTVSTPLRDPQGRVVGKQKIPAHRNRWIVERTDFLAERAAAARVFRNATIAASEGVKAHPVLRGYYLQLQAAKLGAERDIREPQDRELFVAFVRDAIAASIERGEPVEPVRLRERTAENNQADEILERDQAPTR